MKNPFSFSSSSSSSLETSLLPVLLMTNTEKQKFTQVKASIKFVPRSVQNPSSLFYHFLFSTNISSPCASDGAHKHEKKKKNHPKQSIHRIRPWLNAISLLLLFPFFQFLLSSTNISSPCASDDAHKQGKTSRIHPKQSIQKSPSLGTCKTPSFSSSYTSVSSSHVPHQLN